MSAKRKYPLPTVNGEYGEWTVVSLEFGSRGGLLTMECQCSCGAIHKLLPGNVLSGKSTRCDACAHVASGQTQSEYADIIPDINHRERLLNRICAAYSRCYNPKCAAYKDYGGRGVRILFADRRAFLSYLITLPGWDNPQLEIDRINNNGHYAPFNLQFSTRSEQNANRRNFRHSKRRRA